MSMSPRRLFTSFAAAALAGVALTGGIASATPAANTAARSIETVNSRPVLNEDGLGALKLYLTEKAALATGEADEQQIILPNPNGNQPCIGHRVKESTSIPRSAVYFYQDYLAVVDTFDAVTPAGVGVGSTAAEVKSAYPAARVYPNRIVADAGRSNAFVFWLKDGKVGELSLHSSYSMCNYR